jgi:FkbM family methyltransferase
MDAVPRDVSLESASSGQLRLPTRRLKISALGGRNADRAGGQTGDSQPRLRLRAAGGRERAIRRVCRALPEQRQSEKILGRPEIGALLKPSIIMQKRNSTPSLLRLSPTMSLDNVLSRIPHRIYFMQVGAFDGISGDPLHPRVSRFQMDGVLIEPQRGAFEALQQTYAMIQGNFKFINAAIGPSDGEVVLFQIASGQSGPEWLYQIASTRREVVMRHAGLVKNLDKIIEAVPVPCLSFESVFERIGRESVDWLQIDAEGSDAQLLRLFNVDRRHPSVISFEHRHLNTVEYLQAVRWLTGLGYCVGISRDSEGDTIAASEWLMQ